MFCVEVGGRDSLVVCVEMGGRESLVFCVFRGMGIQMFCLKMGGFQNIVCDGEPPRVECDFQF